MFLLLLAAALAALGSYIIIAKAFTQSTRRPPGPKPKFLIGNVLDIPSRNQAEEFIKWEARYGSEQPVPISQRELLKCGEGKILSATELGTELLILNKREDAEELLGARSRIYSSRPDIPLAP